MNVYLVRHAIAEDHSPTLADEDRALTPEGAARMREVVRGLVLVGVEIDAILTSPLVRARETAEILRDGLDRPPLETLPFLAPGGDLASVARELAARENVASVALVGHRPDIGELASLLLTGAAERSPLPFKKGAVALLRTTFSRGRASASLEWFVPPRFLRELGAPR